MTFFGKSAGMPRPVDPAVISIAGHDGVAGNCPGFLVLTDC